jgi:hypothetical protein
MKSNMRLQIIGWDFPKNVSKSTRLIFDKEKMTMEKQNNPETMTRGTALGGVLLIVFGLILLADQIFDFHLGGILWPFMIIVPGIFLFYGAVVLEDEAAKALAILSGIITMIGVVLLVQTITDLWASWSYAWALIAPTGPGIALWLLGSIKDREDLVKTGKDMTGVGLVLFVIAAAFFELVIGINGFGLGSSVFPLLLIGLGLFLLIRNLRHGWHKA